MDKKTRIKMLIAKKLNDEQIEILVAEHDDINVAFQTVAKGVQTALESYDKGDVAGLNVAIDNLAAARKNISDLEKKLTEQRDNLTRSEVAVAPEKSINDEVQ